MNPEHPRAQRGAFAGNRFDRQRGGIGCEHRIRSHDARELREERPLGRDVLHDRFDDQVARGKTLPRGRRCDPLQRAIRRPRLEPAALHGIIQQAANHREPALQARRIDLAQHHFESVQREPVRNPRTHHAPAHDAHALNWK